jgi:streptogramin lyase
MSLNLKIAMTMSRRIAQLGLGCAMILAACSRVSQGTPQTLGGTVKDASGKPAAGALIRVSSVQPGRVVLVVSQENGTFHTPRLPAGAYTVQGFLGDHKGAAPSPVAVSENQSAEAHIALAESRPQMPLEKRLTNDDFSPDMPEGEGKQLIIGHCIHCHYLERIVPTRHTPEQWQKTIERMSWYIQDRPDLQKTHGFKPLTSRQQATMIDYLSKNFGPDRPPFVDPNSKIPRGPDGHLPREAQTGGRVKYTAMEFDFGAEAYEAGIDAEGNLLVSETPGSKFGRINGKTLEYQTETVPAGAKPRVLAQIAEDTQKNVWILDNGPTPDALLIRYTPSTKEYKEFPIPAPPKLRSPLNSLVFVGHDVWGTGNSSTRIVRMNMDTGAITLYPAPRGSHPYGIAVGGPVDGEPSIWTVGNYDNAVNRVDTKAGKLITYRLPDHSVDLRRMGADGDGNLWVAGQDSNKIFMVDYRTGKFTEHIVPTPNVGPYGVDVDHRTGLVWFSEREGDALASFNPKTGTFAEYPLPTKGLAPRRVFVDPVNPRRLWWAGERVGFIELGE